MSLKAIETIHNGYRFRSRLEARWAIFFDFLGIDYQYEPQGYDLGEAGWYLPDFWLEGFTYPTWIEIKGNPPNTKEQKAAQALAEQGDARVYIFYGECWIAPKGSYNGIQFTPARPWPIDVIWAHCDRCGYTAFSDVAADDCPSCGRQLGLKQQAAKLTAAYKAARQARFERGA